MSIKLNKFWDIDRKKQTMQNWYEIIKLIRKHLSRTVLLVHNIVANS